MKTKTKIAIGLATVLMIGVAVLSECVGRQRNGQTAQGPRPAKHHSNLD